MSNFWDILWLIFSTFVFIAYILILFQIGGPNAKMIPHESTNSAAGLPLDRREVHGLLPMN